jgi:5'-3' exonuclease
MEDHVELERAMRNNIKIDKTDTEDLKKLFTFLKVKYYQAVGEADSLLASLHTAGSIAGVISEDSDLLTHGVKLVVRGLIDAKNRNAGLVNLYILDKILERFNMTMSQFIDFCILSGCDYCPRIPGLGPVTAFKHVSCGGTPLTCENPDETYKEKYSVARRMFTEHESVPETTGVNGDVSHDEEAFKAWILENTNYTESTLTAKCNVLSDTQAANLKPKITIKPKPKNKSS